MNTTRRNERRLISDLALACTSAISLLMCVPALLALDALWLWLLTA